MKFSKLSLKQRIYAMALSPALFFIAHFFVSWAVTSFSKEGGLGAFNVFLLTGGVLLLPFVVAASFLAKSVLHQISHPLKKLKDCYGNLAAESSKLNHHSIELSTSSDQQAASLQETVASVNEINSIVQNNNQSAEASVKQANSSRENAEKGQGVMLKMYESMKEISGANNRFQQTMEGNNQKFNEIIEIIRQVEEKAKVINDIVFQTKLLSFNASVEAARAGEQGKGFAVVAEEVGSLARMSGEAADEIGNLLSQSTEKVEQIVETATKSVSQIISETNSKVSEGEKFSEECRTIFGQILNDTQELNSLVEQISLASKEQATGIDEINVAISDIDSTNHKNNSSAQEISVFSGNMQKYSKEIFKIVKSLEDAVGGGLDVSDSGSITKIDPKKLKDKLKSAFKKAS